MDTRINMRKIDSKGAFSQQISQLIAGKTKKAKACDPKSELDITQ